MVERGARSVQAGSGSRSPRSRIARAVQGALVGLIALGIGAPPTAAAGPSLNSTMSVSPSPAIDGTEVTWKAVVTPVNGPSENVQLSMSSRWFMVSVGSSFVPAGGTCEPAANCSVDGRTGNPTWVFPTIAAPITLKFHTLANSGETTSLQIESNTACSGTCPATAKITVPSASVKVTFVPDSPQITTGTILHVTVTGTSTAGPMDADLQAKFSAGLAPPTAIDPSSAVYSGPPYNYLDSGVSLNKTAVLKFDTVVTASPGSTVKLTGTVFPVNSKYPAPPKVISIAVGTGAPAPTPTPRATTKPSAKPTAAPGPTATAPPSPSPSPSESTVGSAAPSASSPPTASIDSSEPPPDPTPSATTLASPSTSPEPAPSSDVAAGPEGPVRAAIETLGPALAIPLLGGIGGTGYLLLRRRGRGL